MRKIIWGIMIFMGILSFLTGCGGGKGSSGEGSRAKDNESGISSFRYGYNGTVGGGSYSYEVKEKDGKIVYIYESMDHREFGDMEMECSRDILGKLYELYKNLRIAEWNGFSKSNPNVLDGDGFSLDIQFVDNERLSAYGSNSYPKGFGTFESEMHLILDPLRDEVHEKYVQELISKGINGKLDSVMVHFLEQGTSGKDEYDFFLISESYRENNCEIKYRSVSEEYLPKGEKNCYVHLPLAEANLDELQKIIEDYNIISWYDYDKSAEDYNNSEWFQIDFGFDDDMRIEAYGTEHPENYDEFRAAFLKWFVKIVEKF